MFTVTTWEYSDIHYMYDICDSNSVAAARGYGLKFLNRRLSDQRVFQKVHNHLCEHGIFPKSSTECPIKQALDKGDNTLP